MLGWTRRINWGHWKRLKMLAFALVAVSVFPAAAAAMLTGDRREASEAAPQYQGVAVPDGLQAQPSAGAPVFTHDAPQLRRSGPETVYVTDGSRSDDGVQSTLGFALGVVLASIAAIALLLSRRRIRVAHA